MPRFHKTPIDVPIETIFETQIVLAERLALRR
jgi:hypothetical protein